jgi:hypothetical protein
MEKPKVGALAPTTTLAQQLCRRVLATVRVLDASATITSVAKWDRDDSTLVRVRINEESISSFTLASALRLTWPLAQISLVENFSDGTTEAQILVPSKAEQFQLAMRRAQDSVFFRRLSCTSRSLQVMGVVVFLAVVVSSLLKEPRGQYNAN